MGDEAPADDFTSAVEALRGGVKGPVLLPDDNGFDQERSGYQTGWRHHPAVIVGATCAADVRTAVAFAAARGLAVAAQATGHGLAVPASGGVLISTRRMGGVRVDADARTAHIAAGIRWKEVIEAAEPFGLAPLNGSAPDVGAVGYTLGGGLGILARRFGYAADHVRGIEVVTADARPRHVSATSEPDLFWALRGGRDNFGIVTGMEVELVPVVRLYGGGMYFDTALVLDVLDAFRRWTMALPDDMTASVGLIPLPNLPMVPEPIRGRYVAHVRIAYTGDVAAGEQLVAPLRAVGPRLLDTLGELPYTASGSIYNDPPMPDAYYGSNALLRELDASAIPAMLETVGPNAPVRCVVELRHLGGALARPPAIPCAIGHRDARYLLRVISLLGTQSPSAVRPMHERLYAALAPWIAGQFLNFAYDDTSGDLQALYEPDDLRRLRDLKAVYDPTNMFRLNHNIPPASGSGG